MYLIGYVFLSLEDFLSPISELILTIIGVVIADLAVAALLAKRGKPRIVIDVVREFESSFWSKDVLGFNVSVKRKMVKDARVRCNDISYPWKVEGGNEIDRKDLWAGDKPSSFFPFKTNAEYIDDISKYTRQVAKGKEESGKGVLVIVREVTTQKIVFSYALSIPTGTTGMVLFAEFADKPRFDVSIRIIGEGIEEVRDYSLYIGLSGLSIPVIKEGKPLMDYVSFGFELKKRRLI